MLQALLLGDAIFDGCQRDEMRAGSVSALDA